MNSFAAIVFFAALAAANAGLIAPLAYSAIPTGHIVQGPSSRTTVVGPDGSAISSVAPGGTIVTDHGATIVSQAAPAAVIAPAARLAYAHAPLVAAHSSLIAAPAITTYAAHAPVLAHHAVGVPAIARIAAENTLVAGPSGTISQTRALDAGSHLTVW